LFPYEKGLPSPIVDAILPRFSLSTNCTKLKHMISLSTWNRLHIWYVGKCEPSLRFCLVLKNHLDLAQPWRVDDVQLWSHAIASLIFDLTYELNVVIVHPRFFIFLANAVFFVKKAQLGCRWRHTSNSRCAGNARLQTQQQLFVESRAASVQTYAPSTGRSPNRTDHKSKH
jgi:hypothetical protein